MKPLEMWMLSEKASNKKTVDKKACTKWYVKPGANRLSGT